MALAGFEPANLGTKDQHSTSRPPKFYIVQKYITVQNLKDKDSAVMDF